MSKKIKGDESPTLASESSGSPKTSELAANHTSLPWVVQQLNHVDGELWLQIGWIENGHGLGPICEMVGGAVRPTPSFKAVAEFKYLVAPDAEVRANAELIVKAVNSHAALVAALRALTHECTPQGRDLAGKSLTVTRMPGRAVIDQARAALALATTQETHQG